MLCGVIWCNVMWYYVMWCDMVWCDMVWCYVVLYGVMWCDMMSCDVVWCDVIWCGMVWFFGASWRRTGRAGGEVKWLGGKIRWCRCWDKLTSANWAAVRAGSYSHTIKWQVNQRSNSSRREEAETTLLGSVIEVMAHEEKRRRSTVEGTRKEGGRECVTRGNRERNVSNEGGEVKCIKLRGENVNGKKKESVWWEWPQRMQKVRSVKKMERIGEVDDQRGGRESCRKVVWIWVCEFLSEGVK